MAGGQLRSPHKSSRKTRLCLPPSFLLVVWSQVSEGAGEEGGGEGHTVHVCLVELELVICCRGAGEASVFRLTSLSIQTSSNMVGKNYFSSSSSSFVVPPRSASDQQG